MQKIEGLLKPMGVSLTLKDKEIVEKRMKDLKIKYFSEYIRYLIRKDSKKYKKVS